MHRLGAILRFLIGWYVGGVLVAVVVIALTLGLSGLHSWHTNREMISMTLRDFMRTRPSGTWVELTDCLLDPSAAIELPAPVLVRLDRSNSIGAKALFAPLLRDRTDVTPGVVLCAASRERIDALSASSASRAGVVPAHVSVRGIILDEGVIRDVDTERALRNTFALAPRGLMLLIEGAAPSVTWPMTQIAVALGGALLLLARGLAGRGDQRSRVPPDTRSPYNGPELTYEEVIEETRANLGRPRRDRLPREFEQPRPQWLRSHPYDGLNEIFESQRALLNHGRVVWAYFVQANEMLYEPGDEDSPAAIIWSADAYFDANPLELRTIARALYELKGAKNAPEELRPFADTLTNEYTRDASLRVPASLAGERDVRYTSIMVIRPHLPGGMLTQPLVPLLILPERTQWTMIVPGQYWSNFWATNWKQSAR